MRIIVTACLFVGLASAQSKPASPSFEVASIKPAAPPPDGMMRIMMGGDAGRINYTNVSLMDLIWRAFGVLDSRISGPDWIGSARFDVVGKFPPGATREQVPAMLQTLLADRFKLTFHKEPKVLPAYALVAGKGGPKLQNAEGEAVGFRMMMGPKGRHMTGKGTMQQFAEALSNGMDRPVLDKTELKGTYDIDLEWSGGDGPQFMRGMAGPGGPGGPGAAPRPEGGDARPHDESADAPSIFTALQAKLGLKLDPRKESVDVLIIDNAEKVPTEN